MTSFDALAVSYDQDFTHTHIGRFLRGQVQSRLLQHFAGGQHVLEMGCGTGEDALFLGERGIQVTATDASEEMLQIARKKTQHLQTVDVRAMTLRDLHAPDASGYDGAFSNFGALNCLDDWQSLASSLARMIAPGGIVGFGIMAPYCVWEVLWHGLHFDFEVAGRRIRGSTFDGIPITYPTVKRIEADFSPYFQRVHLMPLGLFLPPSDVFGVIEKRPNILRRLISLEQQFNQYAWLAQFADHYWIELERTSTGADGAKN